MNHPASPNKLNNLCLAKENLYYCDMTVTTHLRALQALELALRKGSLKSAADELSISAAAVGQRIKSLEDYLGFDLVVRGRSGIRPTNELTTAKAHLTAAFRELETVSRLLDFQRVNEIHIVADSDWADLWLSPRLDAFKKQNPNTRFCVNGEGDVPMRIGDADCEIWFGASKRGDNEYPLFKDYLLPIASPVNTKRVAEIPLDNRLEGFPLLHLDCYTSDHGEMGWKEWTREFGHRATAPERGIRYKKIAQALEAVYADAGFLICGLSLVKSKIDQGQLSIPFDSAKGRWSSGSYWVRFTGYASRRQAFKNFLTWLLKEAEATKETLKKISIDVKV